MRRRCWLFAVTLGAVVGCGGSTPSAPSIPQVAGKWTGTATLLSATGGECLAQGVVPFIGMSHAFSLDVTQTGSVASATIGTCSYTGTVTATGFSLSVSQGSCTQVDQNVVVCPNGAARFTQLVSSVLSFAVNGNIATGTDTDSTNVIAAFENGVQVGGVVGVLTTTASISVSR